MSLRLKLLLPVLFACLVALGFLNSIWIPHNQKIHTAEYLAEVDRHVDSIIVGLIPLVLANRIDIINENLDQLREESPDWEHIVLTNNDGQQLYPLMTGDAAEHTDHQDLQRIEKKIAYFGKPLGLLRIDVNMASWIAEHRVQNNQLVVLLVAIILLVGLSWITMIEGIVIRPMRRLSLAAMALTRREFDSPLPHAGKDEVGVLIKSFAVMRDDLRSYQETLLEEIHERLKAELELMEHKQHLEDQVAQRTADLLSAKEAAEAASIAKSTFLSNMSHELRTPMHAIMGMIDLVLRQNVDARQQDQLSKAKQASQHLLRIINDILDISKIEAQRLRLEQTNFKIGEVLENLMSLIGHKAMDKKLKILVDLDPGLPGRELIGDPLRLSQILLNLTSNAVKFTEQGAITLHARLVEENTADVVLRFEIRDSGIGISHEDQQRLFNAFEQADGSMTRRYGGTGLGLAISKCLVHLMGGEIGVESQAGVGSTFWFVIRMGKSSGTAVATAPDIGRDTAEVLIRAHYGGAHILLVEDEPINQEVSRGLLEDVGFNVDLAEDGAAAVELARHTAYDLILMDMQMPKLNGVDATRVIRRLPGHANTPILAMTANAFDEDRQVCLAAGMNEHIGKPVNPERLFEIILKWLDGNVD